MVTKIRFKETEGGGELTLMGRLASDIRVKLQGGVVGEIGQELRS
jgi:hypothetical protein